MAGQAPSGNAGRQQGDKDKKKDQQKKWEPPLPTRVGKKKKRGPAAASKLPPVHPNSRCRLKLLKMERIKDHLLLEEEFVQNQERLKPQEDKDAEERTRVDDLRGTPMTVGTLEEIIDDEHAIVSSSTGPEHYVPIMSFVDKDMLEPGCQVLLHNNSNAVVGVLADDADPMVSVMKVDKAPTESYADVGGLDQQIQEIKESVELPLTHPELYEEMGIRPPKGVILYGPPGTGKTLLAKAVANQTSATFLRMVGSELIQKYLGDGPKLVRELFRVADENAPTIIFLDEIDAIGSKRYDSSSSGEREIQRTLLELLNQMDGFDTRNDVKVIMATNKIENLDPALIRPGRIDRKIEFPLPDHKIKMSILRIHTSRMNLAADVDLETLISENDGLSGADIKALATEAGLLALRERRMQVTKKDLDSAKERVLARNEDQGPAGLYL
ncbi:26S proteasome subunit P45 [Jaminaea rosea]|uniref:26S proteasome subunit P45 n=1 Tax=Jaminaea rosea TaxID=1569628 RepID=A0A316V1M2_9BASI|nr:26S proteasome subunit P45 [Jaminaea rosea]PWN30451.1 26S proteasome subunit P45 [Jaminaea rosea]